MKKLFFLLIFLGALYWGFYQGTDIPLHTESHSNDVTSEHTDFKTNIKTSAASLHTYFSKNSQADAKSDKDSQKETDAKESQGSSFQFMNKATTLFHFKEALESRLKRDSFIPFNDIPDLLKKAIIATEDRRFYHHGAIDLIGIGRAAVTNYTEGHTVEGGSTISQQTVKNIFLYQDRTMMRKAEELILAMQLERDYTKNEILDIYLNTIYFGHGAYGIKEAAHTYFKKDVSNLSLAECAMLAGLPKAPSDNDPIDHIEAGKARMETVLSLMVQEKYITQEEARHAFTSFSMP